MIGLTILALVLGSSPCYSQSTTPAASQVAAPGSRNPYDAHMTALQAHWDGQSPVERAATLIRIYQLREYINAPETITQWISRVEQDASEPPALRAEARRYAALMSLHAGHVAEIPALASDLLGEAQAEVAKNPNSAALNEALGSIEREHRLASASEHMERAARLSPTAERWREV